MGVVLTAGFTDGLAEGDGEGEGDGVGVGSGVADGEGETVSPRTCGFGKTTDLTHIPVLPKIRTRMTERITVNLEGLLRNKLENILALYPVESI